MKEIVYQILNFKMEVLQILPSQNIDSFISKLSKITFHESNESAEAPIGKE